MSATDVEERWLDQAWRVVSCTDRHRRLCEAAGGAQARRAWAPPAFCWSSIWCNRVAAARWTEASDPRFGSCPLEGHPYDMEVLGCLVLVVTLQLCRLVRLAPIGVSRRSPDCSAWASPRCCGSRPRRSRRSASRARPTSPSATGQAGWRRATSTVTGTPTWPSPTSSRTACRCCSATGRGALARRPASPPATAPYSVAVGDFNGDGDPDLAVANVQLGQRLGAARRRGRGLRRRDQLRRRRRARSAAVGDFDGDWRPRPGGRQRQSANVSVLLGDGAGASAPRPTSLSATRPCRSRWVTSTATANADLAVANQAKTEVSVLLGDAGGGLRRRDQLRCRQHALVGGGG